ncbi:MAG: tetratricopeptide repeat protein, partial [Myxococcota bacterium]
MADIELSDDIDEIVERYEALFGEDELEDARELIDAAIAKFPDAPVLHASSAELHVEGEDYDAAVAAIDTAMEGLDDDEVRAALMNIKARALFYKEDFDASRKLFNETMRLDPELWEALLGRAEVHETMGFLVAAVLDLERAIELDDQEAEPFAQRGRVLLKRGQVDEAERDFGYAIDSDPFDEPSRLSLARILALKGLGADAVELLEPLINHGEDADLVFPAYLLRSQMSLALGSVGAAVEDAEAAIEMRPDEPWGYLQKAACYLTSLNGDEALAALSMAEKFVKNRRDLPDLFALRAAAYEAKEDDARAQKERQKAEGTSQLPGIVYGPLLNPARDVPINPNNPVDVRGLLTQLFGDPDSAPQG